MNKKELLKINKLWKVLMITQRDDLKKWIELAGYRVLPEQTNFIIKKAALKVGKQI